MRHLVVAIAMLALTAGCSSDAGTGSANGGEGWDLVDAGGGDAANGSSQNARNSGGSNGNAGTNGATTNNAAVNNGQTTNAVANNVSTNNGTTNNQNNVATDAGMPGGGDTGAGIDCLLNSECADGLVCCPGFDGSGTCQADCLTGGLCGGNEDECGDDRECCDLSNIGGPPTCLRRCGGGGGGGGNGTPCDTNPDCQQGEVCCPGFDGNGECQPSGDCFTGGACEAETDCMNGQQCCDFNVGTKVCLDQCSF